MRRLVLVRHAESTNNDLYARTGARVGRVPDPLLSPYGEKQAELLAAALADDHRLADAPLWVSPTARAVQTGAALARAGVGDPGPRGATLVLVPDLVEGGGIYRRVEDGRLRSDDRVAVAGRPLAELSELAVGVAVRWVDDEAAAWGGGLEDYDAIPARAARLVERVRASDARTIVAVAHEWLAQHLIRAALGLPEGNAACDRGWFGIPNASVTEIVLKERTATLARLGDVHHLGELVARAPERWV
ncbi:histidine phosphatase family protein [Arsenicicoccus dermatophilus]|uniref:histidine phosphatase family protein n=1 Tax=Arsenicicoccus dermatophilus TaxID=1076331 RepID=UPI00391707A6